MTNWGKDTSVKGRAITNHFWTEFSREDSNELGYLFTTSKLPWLLPVFVAIPPFYKQSVPHGYSARNSTKAKCMSITQANLAAH